MKDGVRPVDFIVLFATGICSTIATVMGWRPSYQREGMSFVLFSIGDILPYPSIFKPLVPVYVVLGMFALDGIASIFAVRNRVFAPAILAVGALFLSGHLGCVRESIRNTATAGLCWWPDMHSVQTDSGDAHAQFNQRVLDVATVRSAAST